MNAREKILLYDMLKAASDCLYGCASPDFPENPSQFADDGGIPAPDPASRAGNGTAFPRGGSSAEAFARTPAAASGAGAGGSAPSAAFSGDGGQSADGAAAESRADGGGLLSTEAPPSLEAVAAAVRDCRRCRLCERRSRAVPGTGARSPAVLVVGEGPGEEEDRQGLPFVGRAGVLLDKMLRAISLDRNVNCFIGNVVKCRPPQNRDPLPDEAAACRPFLDAQITALRPAAILAVGRIAAQNLLATQEGIGRLRGKFYEYRGIPLLATYHPSALLRNEDLKRPAWEDLKLFRSRLAELRPDYARDFPDRR